MEKSAPSSNLTSFWKRPSSYIIEILIVFSSGALVVLLSSNWAGDHPIRGQASAWVANLLMIGMVFYLNYKRGASLDELGLQPLPKEGRSWLLLFAKALLALLLGLIGFVLGSIVMANITGVPDTADMSQYNFLRDNLPMLLISLFGVYIVSSFGEELVYRGFLISRFTAFWKGSRWTNFLSVTLSAIVFALAHYQWGSMGVVQTFGMGLAFALVYLKMKRNLWILVLAHAIMDSILLIQMYLAP